MCACAETLIMFLLRPVLFLLRLYFRIFNRLEIIGMEKIPLTGPLIIVANHVSNADPPAILSHVIPYRPTGVLAKKELFSIPVLGRLLKSWGAIPLERAKEGGDLSALRAALQVLNSGRCLVLFPEGTRAKGRTLKPKPGVALLAAKTGAPVLAARIFNAENFSKLGKISIKFGNLRSFNAETYGDRKEAYAEFSQTVMTDIFAITED